MLGKFFISVLLAGVAFTTSACSSDNDEMKPETVLQDSTSEDQTITNMKLNISVNGHQLEATLENNSSAQALVALLEKGDVTIAMRDYANFEKVGTLPQSLPRNDKQITTQAGDIILYQGNQLVIYYDTNSWSFTKLGHIDNLSQAELMEALGTGNPTVTLSISE